MPDDLQRGAQAGSLIYSRARAARLASVSVDFVRLCEKQNLIRRWVAPDGQQGYTSVEIRRLARIRRLREDLEFDWPAVEVILNLRRQVIDALSQVDEIERQLVRREADLLAEIQRLRRRLAEDAAWRR